MELGAVYPGNNVVGRRDTMETREKYMYKDYLTNSNSKHTFLIICVL